MMRPQLGSPPCQLVLTSGLFATARAAASASANHEIAVRAEEKIGGKKRRVVAGNVGLAGRGAVAVRDLILEAGLAQVLVFVEQLDNLGERVALFFHRDEMKALVFIALIKLLKSGHFG